MRTEGALIGIVTLALGLGACGSEGSTTTDRNATRPTDTQDGGTNATPDAGYRTPAIEAGSNEVPQPPAPKVDVTNETISVGQETRLFVLAAPKVLSATPLPVVLAFHGDGGNGKAMRAAYPIDTISEDNAIVVYPTGKSGWDLYTPPATNLDIAFVDALLTSLKSRFTIDSSRVFATGFSSGAFFISQLSCRKPGLFRGIVVQGGGAPKEPNDPNASTWPNGYTRCAGQTMGAGVAAMVIHGESDGVVTRASGEFAADYWAYIDGCQKARVTSAPAPCEKYDGCPANLPVTFCAIPNLGHEIWASSLTTAWGFFASL